MIETGHGNLIEADVEALVNTVNCVGVMGKGIALQFKQAFPANYEEYRKACKRGEVVPGRMFVHRCSELGNLRWIINFPTKRHWRGRSRIEDIRQGLDALAQEITDRGIRSVAVPPLGCGHGGLGWDEVHPLIQQALGGLDDVRVVLFEPRGAPAADERPVRTARPRLTLARALYILLMDRYEVLHYERTLLEVQKLAYFLQEAGQPLKLRFQAGPYGPYADNLNKVLEALEGHFIQGYTGDRSPEVAIQLLPGAAEAADSFLHDSGDAEAKNRLARVTRLIEGFEEPYGLELLASVHWVATKQSPPATGVEEVQDRLATWSDRKRKLLRPHHVQVAWSRLIEEEWIAARAS